MISLESISQALGLEPTEQRSIQAVVIDSRQVQPGSLYVAIEGERFDGHDFALDAEKSGAAAVVCSKPIQSLTIPQLLVKDTQVALGQIAAFYRKGFNCPAIALTGSNGKTTVKEMIASILPQPALATEGNLNNHLGAPLTILKLNEAHRAAVFELGANHIGEIAYTSSIAKPDVALVNNIAPAHIGEFGSIEAIAKTKGEIYDALNANGTAVVNDDDDYAHFWDAKLKAHQVLRFSRHKKADVFASDITFNDKGFALFSLHLPDGSTQKVQLQVPGSHNVSNALAAASCCYAIGLSAKQIAEGLNHFKGVKGRLTFMQGQAGSIIIDDTYNANLRSTLAAIQTLASRPGKKILVLGNMGELGEHTQAHHETVGQTAKAEHIDALFTFGEFAAQSANAFGTGAQHYDSQAHLIEQLKPQLDKHTTVLIKGSRLAAMENIVKALIS